MSEPSSPIYLERTLGKILKERLRQFPVVAVTGIRQSGKTTLVRHLLPGWDYVTLEDLDVRRFAEADPRGFLAQHPRHTILDEFQRVPELASYLQGVVDRTGSAGQFVLTGSQSYRLHEQLSQSLAGRVGLLVLLPLSLEELPGSPAEADLDALLYRGGFPAVIARSLPATPWLASYVATYIERDVRQLVAVRDLVQFQGFLKLAAARAGQLLNLTALAADAGISLPTARQWLSVLEAGHVLRRIPPWFQNARKRLVKTPKLYFADTGLLCRLLDITSPADLRRHAQRGAVLENWVLTELLKAWHHHGEEPPIYFWRDTEGHEVDFLIHHAGRLAPVEVKAGRTVQPDFFRGLAYLASQDDTVGPGLVVYAGEAKQTRGDTVVAPWRQLPAELARLRR